MTEIRVTQRGTGKRKKLDKDQVASFMAELRRTDGFQTDPKDPPQLIAADCVITVTTGSGKREFGLYGRTVLRNMRTRRERQFYMGLLILEWLR